MKIIALDLGDRWTGIAISDPLRIIARPLETVETKKLVSFLTDLLAQEKIETIIVGYPKTLRGTESAQTKAVIAQFEKLREKFPQASWLLWDERLTSKHAQKLAKGTRESKLLVHARAAALILTTYLGSLSDQ